jgi:hypothetical protein
MAFVAALVIGLLALAIAPGHAFYFDVTPKAVVLLAGTAALLVLTARRPEAPRAPRLFTALLLLNGGSLAISTVLSTNRSLSLSGGTWRGFGALMQCAAMAFAWLVAWVSAGRPDRVRAILRGVAISAILAGAYGILRPPGTLGNAAQLTGWLLPSVFLSMALAKMESRRAWRGAARMAAALSLAALIVIGARTTPWAGHHQLLWHDSLSMVARRPLAGYGPEVFLAEFPRFESKTLAQASPDTIYESPRNAFLDVLVAQGALGLLLLCGLIAVGLRAAWKRQDAWLIAALSAGVVGLQFTSFAAPTAVLFLTTIGLAAALAQKLAAPRPAPVFSVAAPVLVLAVLYFALRIALADHELIVTKRLLEIGDFRAATAEYEVYGFWRLPGTSADVWYSRSWMAVARTATDSGVRAQALEISSQAAQRALLNAEEPFLAWYNCAQISAFRDASEEAERDLRGAIGAHPNWYLPHWMLALQLIHDSRWDEAQKEIVLAAELNAGHHPEIAPPLRFR